LVVSKLCLSLHSKQYNMTKILWFSRHIMKPQQFADLIKKFGEIHVTQINATADNAHVQLIGKPLELGDIWDINPNEILMGEQPPLKELVTQFDEFAAVLPIGLQQQILPFCPSNRILTAKSLRVMDDKGTPTFTHVKWEQVTEIKVVVTDL